MKKSLLFLVLSVAYVALSAAVPGKIPVQGTLMDKDGNLISDDAAEITFIIYDAETEGNELWREERTLFIEKGKLAVYLGEIEPVTYEKIGGQDELWLSVTYDGEEMSRIQLGSVPFAHEAQVAHNAEAVGKYKETTLDDYFSATCSEGSYLRGWTGTTPICQADEGGENSGTTYTAGTGIILNDDEISLDQSVDLYAAGTGITISDHIISVDTSLYAATDHNHDGRYYLKSEVYTKSNLYTRTESDGRYHRKNQDVVINGSENNGTDVSALQVQSGSRVMLIDGDEIDSSGMLFLNANNSNAVNIKNDINYKERVIPVVQTGIGGREETSDCSAGSGVGWATVTIPSSYNVSEDSVFSANVCEIIDIVNPECHYGDASEYLSANEYVVFKDGSDWKIKVLYNNSYGTLAIGVKYAIITP